MDMKKTIFTILAVVFMALPAFAGSKAPTTVAGISLGEDIALYKSLGRHEIAGPLSDAPFMDELTLLNDSIKGIRGGSIDYGNCKIPGKVIRIKLKFADRSMRLYDKLLDKYKDTFGNPDEWLGDAFHNVLAWRWNLNEGGREVQLELMYSKLPDLRPGVSIKMTDMTALKAEYDCYKKKVGSEEAKSGKHNKNVDINEFIPR